MFTSNFFGFGALGVLVLIGHLLGARLPQLRLHIAL